MTNGVAHAAATAAAPAKSGSGHGTRRHDASGFGKALDAESPDQGRGARAKPATDTAAPSRWSRTAELLSSTLVPTTAEPARPDAGATTTDQQLGENAKNSLPESASKPLPDSWADLPQHALPEREEVLRDRKADDGEEKTSQAEEMLAAQPEKRELPDGGQEPDTALDDVLAELKRTLAARNTDEKAAGDPAADAVSSDGDNADRDDPKAVPGEAPRTRVPEPLIYLAAMAPAEKAAPPPAEAGKSDLAPADRGRDAKPPAQPSTPANPVATVVAELVAGAKPAIVQTSAVDQAEAARPTTAEAASTDDTAADEAPVLSDKPRESSGQSSPAAARPSSPPGEPPASPAAQSAGTHPQQSGSNSIGDGKKPEGPDAGNSAAPEPRRSGDQPVATPRVEVLADKSFVAPPAQPAVLANTTVTSLTGAIAASSVSHRAVEAAQIGSQADANGTRTLQIQLNPADLGMVTAHLKASGERLSVELRVDTAEAYHRLTRDSDAIVASLKGHGYDIDSVTIVQPQAAPTPAARVDANPSATGTPDRSGGQLASGGSGSGGNGAPGQSSGQQENANFKGSEGNAQIAAGRSGDGVYI